MNKQNKVNKRGKAITLIACVIALLSFLIFASCDIPNEHNNKETATVSLNFSLGRTVFPEASFDNYEFFFSTDGGSPEKLEPNETDGFTFTLEPDVEWDIAVKAYTGEIDEANLAATGSAKVTLVAGTDTTINVNLIGNTGAAGKGFFTYTITMPTEAVIDEISLQKIDGEILGVNVLDGIEAEGSSGEIAAGFYLFSISLSDGPRQAGDVKAVHIYNGLTTNFNADFDNDDFFIPATINIAAISITAPATGAQPVTEITTNDQFSGTVIWSTEDGEFDGDEFEELIVYTAVISLNALPGYSFIGVEEDFFTVSGATSATNNADSGVITAVFPATAEANPCAEGHDFSEWEITTPATCNADGEETEKCSRCETLGTETQAITERPAHTFTQWQETIEPTLSTPAIETEKCSVCETLGTETRVGNSLPITSAAEWASALSQITAGGNGTEEDRKEYTLNIGGDFSIVESTSNTFGATTYITVTLKGNGTVSITNNGGGRLLSVAANQTLIIDSEDLTLQGRTNNFDTLIYMGGNNVKVELRKGVITGNANGTTVTNDGGGVYVSGNGSSFIMSGGIITGNTATRGGGGVYVSFNGSFTLSGNAVIEDDIALLSNDSANSVITIMDDWAGSISRLLLHSSTSNMTAAIGNWVGKTVLQAEEGSALTQDDIAKFQVTTFRNTLSPASNRPTTGFRLVLDSGSAKLEAIPFNMGSNITNAEEWFSALYAIMSGGNNQTYTLNINGDFFVSGNANNSFGTVTGLTVTLQGNGKISIDSATQGNLLRVAVNQTLIIDSENLILHGREVGEGSNNNSSLMITVEGANSRLELKNGTITGNHKYGMSHGSGVSVSGGGSFTMSGGSITDNILQYSTSYHGGGVYVTGAGSSFTMTGGSITNNRAHGGGGGVCITTNASFTMSGGSITGNTGGSITGSGISSDVFIRETAGFTPANPAAFTLSGNAVIGTIVLYATTAANSSITVGDNWTGSITQLDLQGNNSNTNNARPYWYDKTVFRAVEGYTLQQGDLAKFPLGSYLNNSYGGAQAITTTAPIHHLILQDNTGVLAAAP